MLRETHSTVREGLFIGLLGGGAVALWWLVVDTLAGAPLATPNQLGQVFLEGDRAAAPTALQPGAILAYSLVHFAMFAVLGLVLIRLVHLASQHWELRMGLWIGVILTTAWLAFHTYALTLYTRYTIPWWSTVGGALVGVGTMLGVAWRRHPTLRQSLREVPLADEVETPPAPPPSRPPNR